MNRSVNTKNVKFGHAMIVGISLDDSTYMTEQEELSLDSDRMDDGSDGSDKRRDLQARENKSYERMHNKQKSRDYRRAHVQSILALQDEHFDCHLQDPKGLGNLSRSLSKDSVKKAQLRALQNELDASKSSTLGLDDRSDHSHDRRSRRRNARRCQSLLSSPLMAPSFSSCLGKQLY
ncbi:expressed unknown protein [Seminavis robusta]|uniref:Uncharacterized protein n=1 Tax=Seminavis robusta TaxID=568900 RepID=A0A9N8EKN5_9STRA|nr:expressed unknown protein [Seminavis robusta]|eukprot:Sro1236_g255150.1 n/a (177) ;mRNA; r:23257-23787